MRHIRAFAAVAAVCAAAPVIMAASGPTFWTVAAPADFIKGTSDGVYVSLNGALTPGPQLTNRLTAAPAQVWSLAENTDGVLFAGTGGDGRVLRIRATGAEDTLFDADETNVFAVAVSGTKVYAATGPDGRVYVIDGTTPAKPFFDPEEKYIWALAVDGAGRLWVGAGSPGVIYRVDAAGKSQVVYKPPVGHVVSLFKDSTGRMWAGTESPGRLYRFDANDKPFVALDAGTAEVRGLAQDSSGVIFAAAVGKGDDASSGETTAVALAAPPTPSANPGAAASSSSSTARRSVLYRIETNGAWEDIWSANDVIYDLAAQSDGSVLAATGPEGRLYRVTKAREVLLLTGVDAKQITRFATTTRPSGPTAFATANPGRVVTIGTGQQATASYQSPVRDTKGATSWGLIRWEATGPVQLFTRAGNTDRPDDSWSAWSAAYTKRDGELVTSPIARYIQWKVAFGKPANGPAAQLTSVTVAYLPRNARPAVTSVTVYPPGVVFQRPYANDDSAIAGLDELTAEARRPAGDTPPTATPTRRMFQKGLQTIAWKGEDDDNDRLSYALAYRREGEQAWRDLKIGISDGIYVWDTTAVADGRYVIRVRASDAPANATDRALTGDRESEPITVDNTPPTVATELVRQGGASRLVVRVHDGRSPIQKLEYSIGGGSWSLVYPVDGLSDSPDERYEITLGPNDTDVTRIVIRATDTLQNVVSQTATPK